MTTHVTLQAKVHVRVLLEGWEEIFTLALAYEYHHNIGERERERESRVCIVILAKKARGLHQLGGITLLNQLLH